MSQSFVELHFSITVICSIAALYHFFFHLVSVQILCKNQKHLFKFSNLFEKTQGNVKSKAG